MNELTKKYGKCCRTCGLWDIEKDFADIVEKYWSAKCLWKINVPLPFSVSYYFHGETGYTRADKGAACPCWIERTKLKEEK